MHMNGQKKKQMRQLTRQIKLFQNKFNIFGDIKWQVATDGNIPSREANKKGLKNLTVGGAYGKEILLKI